jgi:hypothetical protein
MLVVEGATDEIALAGLCQGGRDQIFPGGSRDLVEQLLTHLQREPIDGCQCVFLVDCDGKGKTVRLANAQELVVTEACDMEADLLAIGVVSRLIRKFVAGDDDENRLVTDAQALGMALSIVRRAANAAEISMKKAGSQFRLTDVPDMHLTSWEEAIPADDEVVGVVSAELGWSDVETQAVISKLPAIRRSFAVCCLGKDVLDAVFRLLLDRGQGDVRGWNRDYFYQAVFESVEPSDAKTWEVGRRISGWEEATGCRLLQLMEQDS